MDGLSDREHRLVPDEFVVVLLVLGIEAGVVVRIPCVCGGARSGRVAQAGFVETAKAARSRQECPHIVALSRIRIAPANEPGSLDFRGSQNRIEAEQPIAM